MGREIGIKVNYKGKEIYSDYVCGRDDGTTFLASYILNHNYKEIEEQGYTLNLHYGDKELKEIKDALKEYADKDKKEIDKAYWDLEDLREARRHASTMEEFTNFSDALDNTLDWIEHESYSRSGSLIEYIDKAVFNIEQDYLSNNLNKNGYIGYINKSDFKSFKDYDIEIYLSE